MGACSHLNWEIRDQDLIGWAYCADCKQSIRLSQAVNCSVNYLRMALHDLEMERMRLRELILERENNGR